MPIPQQEGKAGRLCIRISKLLSLETTFELINESAETNRRVRPLNPVEAKGSKKLLPY